MRVVSLLPSATEIVYALGLDDQLVGVTFECDEPAGARQDKTVVIGGRDTSGMTPGAIDAYVRDQLAAGQDLYTLRADALAALAPELILTQDLCRVCALPAGHVRGRTGLSRLHGRGRLAGSAQPGRRAGDDLDRRPAHRRPQRAEQLVAALRRRLAAVSDRVAGLSPVAAAVAVVEWVDPPFTAGHWVPDLVTAAGGRPVSARPGGSLRPRPLGPQVAAARPDVVVVAPCGFGLDDAAAQAERVVRQLPGIPVWAIDADGLVVRPGPRLVDGVEALAAIVHPDAAAAVPAGRIRRIA